MSEEDIRDIASLRELRESANQFKSLRKAWPALRPIARLLDLDAARIDEVLEEALGIEAQVDEMMAIPDRFSSLFSDRGWILFDMMDLEAAKQAIEIAEEYGIDEAEEFLVNHFSPDWVETRIEWLRHLRGFRERLELARMALQDYKAGRFYASVLVTLSLIDGWVCELNIVDFHRHGFFSEQSELVAWDSIAAHPKGLVKLQQVLGKSRMMTRTEEIRIPYRHGIVHGMDLGYNNRYVAAKCWAALFAVRDWAVKATRDELDPPELDPESERVLWESIESFRRTREGTEWLKRWEPREVTVGDSIPASGQVEDYPQGSPERKIVEFLSYWLEENYGYMATCYAPMLETRPVDARNAFEHRRLLGFELMEITEVTAAVADVKAELELMLDDGMHGSVYDFRLVLSDEEGNLVHMPSNDTSWGITIWRADQ